MFVLARLGEETQLVQADFPDEKIKVGQTFQRMPVQVLEEWQIIKVFDHESQRRLEALQVLIGHVALCSLFEI